MKQTTIPADYFGPDFNPVRLTDELKRRGFVFLSDHCPVKFAGTVTQTENPDGSVTFTQEYDA